MIILEKSLDPDDEIIEKKGHLVVVRPITFYLCRCRECKDTCTNLTGLPNSLGDSPLTGYGKVMLQTGSPLCSACNNNCSQKGDPKDYFSSWKGPYTGKRKQ